MLKKLDVEFMTNERVDEIDFTHELPEKLDAKMYVAIYDRIG